MPVLGRVGLYLRRVDVGLARAGVDGLGWCGDCQRFDTVEEGEDKDVHDLVMCMTRTPYTTARGFFTVHEYL